MSGFTTSSLSTYTVEDKAALRTKSVYGAVSMPLFTIQEGIKYSEKLPYLTTAVAMQADTGCNTINPSGDDGTFAQMTLTVSKIKYEHSWCFTDLETKYTQKYLRKGSKLDENAATSELMNTLMEDLAAKKAKAWEMAIWQSATTNTFNTNLKQFNGFLKVLDTAGGYVNQQTSAGTAYTSITTSNILTILDNQWLYVPADLRRSDNLVTVMGEDTYSKLIIALKNANNFNWTATTNDAGAMQLTYPGTTMKIVAVPGLNADNDSNLPAAFKNRIITFEKDNFVFGTDMISDMEDLVTWFEKKDDKFYVREKFKAACGIFFTDRVVSFATV